VEGGEKFQTESAPAAEKARYEIESDKKKQSS